MRTFINHNSYNTIISHPITTADKLFLSPIRNNRSNIINNTLMDTTIMNSTQTKIGMMQSQMAMMSLTVASMQLQLKELEAEVKRLKRGIIVREEPPSPRGSDLGNITSNLNIDDDDDDGYVSDGKDIIVETSLPSIQPVTGNYIIVDSSVYEDDQGYDDSDDE
jgi:hypothetical protein